MTAIPETRYVSTRQGDIAYQVLGDGPIDLLLCSGVGSHLDMYWEIPAAARFFQGLASFSRLIMFDPRGLGLSDPAPYAALSTWEDWTEDIRTVLDAVGSQRAAIFAERDFTRPAMMFAATSPERTAALILSRPSARYLAAADYPEGQPPAAFEQYIQLCQSKWGTAEFAALTAPSLAHDPASLGLLARTLRASSSPKRAAEHMRYWFQLDVRAYLPTIRVPTLVFTREASRLIPVALFRYVAEHIPGARLVTHPGADIVLFLGAAETVLGEVEEFLTGARHHVEADRVLATVLFTDLVKSTERAAELGDRRYRELLEQHHAAVRRELARFGGKEMDSAGDGFFASFEGPARAIRAWVRPFIDTHKSIGITVLGLALMRLLWRATHPPPPLPETYPRWERLAAHLAHALLYLLIFALPLSGWLHDSAWKDGPAHPMRLFGLVPWPRIAWISGIDAEHKEILHDVFGAVHGNFAKLLYGLFVLHVAGALKHQWFDRDPEIQRMLPWADSTPAASGTDQKAGT